MQRYLLFADRKSPSRELRNKLYLCARYENTCHYYMLLCSTATDSPPYRKRKKKRFGCCILPGREPVTVVYRLFRDDRCQHIGSNLCLCTRYGAKYGHDVYANSFRLFLRLSGGSTRVTSIILPAQSDKYLQLSRHTNRTTNLPYRFFLFLIVPYVRYSCQNVSGLPHSSYLCIR